MEKSTCIECQENEADMGSDFCSGCREEILKAAGVLDLEKIFS